MSQFTHWLAVVFIATTFSPDAWARCRVPRGKVADKNQWRCCDHAVEQDLRGWCTGTRGVVGGSVFLNAVKDGQNLWWLGGTVKDFNGDAPHQVCGKEDSGSHLLRAYYCSQPPSAMKPESIRVSVPLGLGVTAVPAPRAEDATLKPEILMPAGGLAPQNCVWSESSDGAAESLSSISNGSGTKKIIQLPKELCGADAPVYVCVGKIDCTVQGGASKETVPASLMSACKAVIGPTGSYQCPAATACANDPDFAMDRGADSPGTSPSASTDSGAGTGNR